MRVVTLTREELHLRVWSAPLRTVAAEIGISDVGLSKACKRHQIPTPKQGYWLRRGDRKAVAPLPRADGYDLGITFYIDDSEVRPKSQKALRLDVAHIEVPADLVDAHPLVLATKRASEGARFEEGHGRQGYDPRRKHLDIRVSPEQLNRALLVASALIPATEAVGAKWVIDTKGETWISFNRQRMKVRFIEKMRQVPWVHPERPPLKKGEIGRPNWDAIAYPHWKKVGTGELRFEVEAYLPTGIQRIWGGGKRQLETELSAIVAQLPVLAAAIEAREARYAAERLSAEQKRQTRIQAARDAETLKLQRERLLLSAQGHQQAAAVRAYCEHISVRYQAETLTLEDRLQLEDWLSWARAQADHIDPANQPLASVLDRTVALAPGFDSTVRHPFGCDD